MTLSSIIINTIGTVLLTSFVLTILNQSVVINTSTTTNQPSIHPTYQPSIQNTTYPSIIPTIKPSVIRTSVEIVIPTSKSSDDPSLIPTSSLTYNPTVDPTSKPTQYPSLTTTIYPTVYSTITPSNHHPSFNPTIKITITPSIITTASPSIIRTITPNSILSDQPSYLLSIHPSRNPSIHPSRNPSIYPSRNPSIYPSPNTSIHPSRNPSIYPSRNPSIHPSPNTSNKPSIYPTYHDPSVLPTKIPITLEPFSGTIPSYNPSNLPSINFPSSTDFNYFNLIIDPLEAYNQYNNISTKSITNVLITNGIKWFNQVGYTETVGRDPNTDPNYSLTITQKYFPTNAPNIVSFLVDDWGYNAAGYQSYNYLKGTTPNIDRLAQQGIRLTNYYTCSLCTPSRAGFMTGRYAFRNGLDGISGNTLGQLYTSEVTLAQELKSAGYRTNIIGKWDLGLSTNSKRPNYRGFDYFYGYLDYEIDYYTKKLNKKQTADLWENNVLVSNQTELSNTLYSAYLWSQHAEKVIADHSINYPLQPMFLYFASQLVHDPFEAPIEYQAKCKASLSDTDKIYCAMNILLDETVGNLTCALEKYGLASNTLFVLVSDNGGNPNYPGNNYPFRGAKGSVYNGGVRGAGFVSGNLIPSSRRGGEYNGQIHVTDWLPTFMSLATNNIWTGSYATGTIIDGVNIWDALVKDTASPRHEMVLYYTKTSTTATSGDFVYQYDMQKFIALNGKVPSSVIPSALFDSLLPDPTKNTCSKASLLT